MFQWFMIVNVLARMQSNSLCVTSFSYRFHNSSHARNRSFVFDFSFFIVLFFRVFCCFSLSESNTFFSSPSNKYNCHLIKFIESFCSRLTFCRRRCTEEIPIDSL